MQLLELFVSHLLQMTAVAVATWFITRFVTRTRSRLNYALWILVLIKCVTPPLWSSPTGVFSWVVSQQSDSSHLSEVSDETGFPDAQTVVFQLEDSLTEQLPAVAMDNAELGVPLATLDSSHADHNLLPLVQQNKDAVSFAAEFGAHTEEKAGSLHATLMWLFAVWVLGGVVMLAWTLCRAWLFIRKLKVDGSPCPGLQSLTTEIAGNLGLKRSVNLLVTSQRVGPAVVGLFRPLVLVPEFMLDRCSSTELKPILAHELIHIRRGDLWANLFRHVVRSLWWFHPLVWKASAEVRRGAEICCDQEVVLATGIEPKDYARALLNVLEHKSVLKSVPVVPGVRPFDITSNRLERIMKFGHGSQSVSSWWTWVFVVIAAAITLPGAGRIHGEVQSVSETDVALKEASEGDPRMDESARRSVRVPWNLLRREPESRIEISASDVLGIYVKGVLENESFGFPIPVQQDGTIPLPFIDDPKLTGLNVEEAIEHLTDCYSNTRILQEGQTVGLTMIRRSPVKVFVARENAKGLPYVKLELPPSEADVFSVLKETGGLPEANEADQVMVVRALGTGAKVIRIPLFYEEGTSPQIRKSDVALQDNDVVVVFPGASKDWPTKQARVVAETERHSLSDSLIQKREAAVPVDYDKLDRWKMSLDECIQVALSNSHVLRTLGLRISKPVGSDKDFSAGANSRSTTVLTRVNDDISLADAETNARDFLFEVEQAYWNLYFYYHNLDAARVGFDSAHASWKQSNSQLSDRKSGGEAANESQSRAQYFSFKSRLELAKTDLQRQESRLRCLLGLGSKDGRLIQPIDSPTKSRVEFDWDDIKRQALKNSPELRRQRWRVKQKELRLLAARNQLLPQMDSVALYRFLGLSDKLLQKPSAEKQEGDVHAMDELSESDYAEWRLGLEHTTPIGYRAEMTQVRSTQLELARAVKRLEDLELEASHQLSSAFARLRDQYRIAQTQFNTLKAYRDQVRASQVAFDMEKLPLDVVLDAQSRHAQAEIDFYRVLTQYQLAIAEVHYRKGTLLETLGISLGGREQIEKNHEAIGNEEQLLGLGLGKSVVLKPQDFGLQFDPVDSATLRTMDYRLDRPNVVSRGSRKQPGRTRLPGR